MNQPPCLVTANQVAHQLLVNGRGSIPSKPKRPVLPPATEGDTSKVYPFSEGEYNKGVAALKNDKAAGRDDILVEQLKHIVPKAHKWLLTILNICCMENKIPTIWRQSKNIATLKPGKDSSIPKNYRPISLLCHTYKLYERNDTEQDSTCHRTTPNQGTGRFQIREIMHRSTPKPHRSGRRLYVELNNERKQDGEYKRTVYHRGVFSSPSLFNIYTNDRPILDGTRSFIYADDLCITAQYPTFQEVEQNIEEALVELTHYYKSNNLRANPDKTQVTAFSSAEQRGKEVATSIMEWSGPGEH